MQLYIGVYPQQSPRHCTSSPWPWWSSQLPRCAAGNCCAWPHAAEKPLSAACISPVTPKHFGVLWDGRALLTASGSVGDTLCTQGSVMRCPCTPLSSLSAATSPVFHYRQFTLISSICREHLSPSFNNIHGTRDRVLFTASAHGVGIGAPQTTTPKQMVFEWAGRQQRPSPAQSIPRSEERFLEGTNKLFCNFWLLMAQSGPNEPSG